MPIISTTGTNGIGTPYTVNYPATVNEGDLLTLVVFARGNTNVSHAITTPSGWTRRSSQDVYDSGNAFLTRNAGAVFTRVAPAGLGGGNFAIVFGDGTPSPRWFASITRSTGLEYNVDASARAESATQTFPAVTTTANGAEIIRVLGQGNDYVASPTTPSGYSILDQRGYANGGSLFTLGKDDPQATAGVLASLDWVFGVSTPHYTATVALTPAAAASGPTISEGTFVTPTTGGFTPRVTTDTADGTMYYVVQPNSVASHTNDEAGAIRVRNGLDGAGDPALRSGSQAVTEAGVVTFPAVTGLSSNTTYKLAFTHRIVVET
jgi:hypothetical protein